MSCNRLSSLKRGTPPCRVCSHGSLCSIPTSSQHSFSSCLQGEEDYEVVPGTQFTISRTAHANNTSNYYLGDKKSSYGEVVDLLKGRGIDLDNNRFLILQVRF